MAAGLLGAFTGLSRGVAIVPLLAATAGCSYMAALNRWARLLGIETAPPFDFTHAVTL